MGGNTFYSEIPVLTQPMKLVTFETNFSVPCFAYFGLLQRAFMSSLALSPPTPHLWEWLLLTSSEFLKPNSEDFFWRVHCIIDEVRIRVQYPNSQQHTFLGCCSYWKPWNSRACPQERWWCHWDDMQEHVSCLRQVPQEWRHQQVIRWLGRGRNYSPWKKGTVKG